MNNTNNACLFGFNESIKNAGDTYSGYHRQTFIWCKISKSETVFKPSLPLFLMVFTQLRPSLFE